MAPETRSRNGLLMESVIDCRWKAFILSVFCARLPQFSYFYFIISKFGICFLQIFHSFHVNLNTRGKKYNACSPNFVKYENKKIVEILEIE